MRYLIILLLSSVCFGEVNRPINSFTGGKGSPLMEARTDYEKYDTLSRQMENMIPFPQGTVNKRPGTKYVSSIPLEICFGSGQAEYPTLHELDASEIPAKPSEPADTALVGATSVTDAAGLQAIAGAGHYSIDADIDLTGVAWNPIVGFSGIIEGNGKTISNLTYENAYASTGTITADHTTETFIDTIGVGTSNNFVNDSAIVISASIVPPGLSANTIYYIINATSQELTPVTINYAVSNVNFNSVGHALVNGDLVRFDATGGVPIGLSESSNYYVVNAAPDVFNLSLTPGGAARTFSSNGSGTLTVYKRSTCQLSATMGGSAVAFAGNGSGVFFASPNAGLFYSITGSAEIRNLTLDGFSITGNTRAAALVAYISAANVKISDIAVTNATIKGDEYCGGLIGYAYNCGGFHLWRCTVTDSTVSPGTGQDGGRMGGLVGGFNHVNTDGARDTAIIDCYSTGTTVTGKLEVGGLFGSLITYMASGASQVSHIHSCYSTNDVYVTEIDSSGKPEIMGGFAGQLGGGQITSCYATGDVVFRRTIDYIYDGWDYVGGFAGIVFQGNESPPSGKCNIINCYATGDIVADDTYIDNLGWIGGFSGKIDTEGNYLLRCYSTGKIDTTAANNCFVGWMGGFTGGYRGCGETDDHGEVRRCFSWTDISFTNPVSISNVEIGGFVGGASYYPAETIDCYTWSNIYIGGVSVSEGNYEFCGGFVGLHDGGGGANGPFIFDNVYCAQPIHSTGYFAPANTVMVSTTPQAVPTLFAQNIHPFEGAVNPLVSPAVTVFSTVTESFFDSETAGSTVDTSDATPHDTATMKTKATFTDAGWAFSTEYGVKDDIDSIWTMPLGSTCYDQTVEGDTSGTTRLIPFEYSTDDAYVLAFGNNSMSFYRNGGQIAQ